MRFLVMALVNPDSQPTAPPKPESYVAMQEYNAAAAKDGILLAAGGLMPKGVRVRFSGEEPLVTDGPFTESKELIAGLMIIKVNSFAEAIEWVKRAPNDAPDGKGLVEIRKPMDLEDFGEGFTPNEDIAKVKY